MAAKGEDCKLVMPEEHKPIRASIGKRCFAFGTLLVSALMISAVSRAIWLSGSKSDGIQTTSLLTHQGSRTLNGPLQPLPGSTPPLARRVPRPSHLHTSRTGHLGMQRPQPLDLSRANTLSMQRNAFSGSMGGEVPYNPRPDLKTLADPDIDTTIVDAVQALKGRMTVADVAAKAGADLEVTRRNLVDLAYLTEAAVLVSKDGEMLYDFGSDPKARLAAASLRARALQFYQKAQPVLMKIYKYSFGFFLFFSITLISLTLTILVQAAQRDGQSNSNSRGGGGVVGGGFGGGYYRISPFDFFYIDMSPRYKDPTKMNFLMSIFSFVFGDGNPNEDFDAERWRTISNVIRANKGVVVADQLAPYLDLPSNWEYKLREDNDEAFVLQVLQRFNGQPEVAPDGTIVYVFDELMTTAKAAPGVPMYNPRVPKYLEKIQVGFSRATIWQKILTGLLGSVNLGLAFTLGNVIREAPALFASDPYLRFVQGIFPLLAVYAVAFIVTPIVRAFRNRVVNEQIVNENTKRAEAAAILSRGDANRRIEARSGYLSGVKAIRDEDIVFRSDMAMEPQALSMELDEFDRKLGK